MTSKKEKQVETPQNSSYFQKGGKILQREVAKIQGCDVPGLLSYCSSFKTEREQGRILKKGEIYLNRFYAKWKSVTSLPEKNPVSTASCIMCSCL